MEPKPPQVVLEVCSRDEAGAILTSPEQRADVAFLVSISDPDLEPPLGYDAIDDKVRLLFADANDDSGVSEEHIRRIIDLAGALSEKSGRVVIHCLGGVSRSSAAAVILRLAIHGGSPEDAVAAVVAQRPVARPNRRMIAIADRLLGLDGRLIDAVAAIIPRG